MAETWSAALLLGAVFGLLDWWNKLVSLILWFVLLITFVIANVHSSGNIVWSQLIAGVIAYLIGYYGVIAWAKNIRRDRKRGQKSR